MRRFPYTDELTIVVIAGAVVIVAAVVARFIVPPRWRRKIPEIAGLVMLGLALIVLAGRGLLEFSIIDFDDPSSYRDSWGGPGLAGVIAVHTAPTLIIVVVVIGWLLWRRARKRADT